MRSARTVASLGLLAATALAAGGCGGSVSAATLVSAASAKTTATYGAQIHEHVVITPTPGSATAPQDITADGSADFLLQQADLTTTAAGQHVEVVVDSGTFYEKFAALTALTGKAWLKIDLNTLGQAAGVKGLGDLARSQSNDPIQGLQFLRGVTGSIITVGRETVRGTATTHYKVTTDLNLAAQKLPAAQQATMQQVVKLLGVHIIAVDVWIDAQGLARRYSYVFDYSAAKFPAGVPTASLPKTVATTVELYNFGPISSITVPGSDQYVDLATILHAAASTAPPATTPTTATPTTTPAPVVPTAATTALEHLLITTLPAGFVQAADSVGDSGPSDLAKAVRDDGAPGASQALTSAGFVAGYQRQWTGGQDDQILVFLYQFRTPAGALAYLARSLAAAPPSGDTLTPFAVSGIPGASGMALSGKNVSGFLVLFPRHGYLGQIIVAGTDASQQLAVALAAEQYGRL